MSSWVKPELLELASGDRIFSAKTHKPYAREGHFTAPPAYVSQFFGTKS